MSSVPVLPILLTITSWVPTADLDSGAEDSLFIQEYHEAYPIGNQADMNDVRAALADRAGDIWAPRRPAYTG